MNQEPVVKSTISTQRANFNKTMKRNISFNKMRKESSLGRLEMSDKKVQHALAGEKIDKIELFNQSSSVNMNKTKKAGVTGFNKKSYALESGWKTTFGSEANPKTSIT